MKLTIFGASGRTGRPLMMQALDAGHEVTAFVRTPAKLDVQHENLTVVQGDVRNPTQVETAVTGADAVLSVLGPTANTPDYQVCQGTEHILTAMKKHGVRRLVISAGAGVGDPADAPRPVNKLINLLLRLVSPHVYEDMKRTVDLVRASDLDWTIVRVPRLTDDPPTGQVKTAYVGKGMGMRITRADMASFMLQQVDDTRFIRQAPAISNM
ncbi:MAG: SDR family oxidoreductase [Anaerolineales bacterium]|nr:SDR family oxidoreductase [Anaerolineales bacterium]